MTTEESQLFALLDKYSRTSHRCFLAEMLLQKDGDQYLLCFRPAAASEASTDRYACRYIHVEFTDAQRASRTGALTATIKAKLDRELPSLGQPRG
jgi:hypothetical protein